MCRRLVSILPLLFLWSIRCLAEDKGEKCTSREPSVVINQVRGRLGNHIWGYMTVLALEFKYGLRFQVPEESIGYLHPFFPSLKLHPASKDFYPFYDQFMHLIGNRVHEHYRKQSGNHSLVLEYNVEGGIWTIPPQLAHLEHINVFRLLDTTDFQEEFGELTQGSRWEIFMKDWDQLALEDWKTGRFLYVPSGTRTKKSDIFMAPGFDKKLAERLVLKDEYLQIANQKLSRIQKQLGTHKKILYVGIHSRRSDHIAYESKIGLKPLKNDYFKKAIRLFRQRFEKKKKSKVVLAFIFVSDDMNYGSKVLLPTEKNVFFLGTGDGVSTKGIGTDLGLLASCNHTILSYGSFSFFAGFLSGGVKVIPEHFAEYRTSMNEHIKSLDDNPFDKPLPRLHFLDQMK